jgi:cation:H+ antiporter
LNVSSLVIGLTVVAFGTSAPELFVNVYASMKGNTEIAIGNILGSNIANILLILGVSAIIYPLAIQRSTTWKEIPLSVLAAIVVGVMANDVLLNKEGISSLTRSDGIILLAFFSIFMYYIIEIAVKSQHREHTETKMMPWTKAVLFVVLGLGGLVLGGQWIVNGAVEIASRFNLSQSFVGLTIVAIGTSLPELATSIVAAHKKNVDIAVGNVIGSNIFNLFFVLGISSIIKPLPFHPASGPDILMTVFASLLMFGCVFLGQKHKILRWQGILFVFLYFAYLVYLVWRG